MVSLDLFHLDWTFVETDHTNGSYIYHTCTLQGANIFHLRERNIIFKNAWGWDMLVPRRVSRRMGCFIMCSYSEKGLQ